MENRRYKWIIIGVTVVIMVIGGSLAWNYFQAPALPLGFASGNGRIEATEVDIAAKYPGRLIAVLAREGEMVTAGQILARMDTISLQAELKEAEAKLSEARNARQRAIALVVQRKSESALAEKEYGRSHTLFKEALITRERLDRDRTKRDTTRTILRAAQIQVKETSAAIGAAVAKTEKIQAEIDDSALKAPISGRVLYRLAEPGEVLPAGGKILTVLDLGRVYMTIFLPTSEAGKVDIGTDARITVDARPGVVVPAKVSFVAPRAQFTPKEVETRSERDKLMFRIKVKVDPEVLKKHVEKVKTGVPGVAYIRLDPGAEWPQHLQIKLPQ